MTEFLHKPVLLKETIEHLITKKDGIYVDCTSGLGGHSQAILDNIDPQSRLIAIDRDAESKNFLSERLNKYNNWVFAKDNFININTVLNSIDITGVDGVLLDLGISSYQIDNPERGFSFNSECLDMRMDRDGDCPSAKDLVNSLKTESLEKIIKEFGEDYKARRIADSIIRARSRKTIESAVELAEIIEKAIGRRERIHPATRTFQALRIAVNNELENEEKGLNEAIKALNPQGRVVVISFHSLEDRIAKYIFKNSEQVKIITKKPIIAQDEERKENPRSRSAKLRVAEKIV